MSITTEKKNITYGNMSVESFLAYVDAMTDAYGWIGYGDAKKNDTLIPTCRRALEAMADESFEPSEKNIAEAKAITEWLKTQDDEINERTNLLRQWAFARKIPRYHAAEAALGLFLYRTREERQAKVLESFSRRSGSEFVGKPGDFYHLKAIVHSAKQFGSAHNKSVLHTFEDEDNNVIMWNIRGTTMMEVGSTFEGDVRVISHDVYKGIKQTRVTAAGRKY